MTKSILVFSCAHAVPEVNNKRFDTLGKFIYDRRPDTVIDLGDGADMKSLNSYDTRYPEALVSQAYEEDIDVYLDSQERLRKPFKVAKKKKPKWIGFEGNHENRIKKYLAENPRMAGSKYGVSFNHLQTDKWFDEYHEYLHGGPAIANYNGVDFSHFFSSGNFGSATSGVHHAYTVINNRHNSSVCGHSHKRDLYFKDGPGSIGLVVGCFKGHAESWAGQANRDWWTGAVMLHDVKDGRFEPEFISLSQMERKYG